MDYTEIIIIVACVQGAVDLFLFLYMLFGASAGFSSEKKLKIVEDDFRYLRDCLDVIQEKIGIDIDKEIEAMKIERNKKLSVSEMEIKMPVVLLNPKETVQSFRRVKIEANTEGHIYAKYGNVTEVVFKIDDKNVFVRCKNDELKNGYLDK